MKKYYKDDYLTRLAKLAQKKKWELTVEQEKKVVKAYIEAGQDYYKRFASAPSGKVTKVMYYQYTKELRDKVKPLIEQGVIEADSIYFTMYQDLNKKVLSMVPPTNSQYWDDVSKIVNVQYQNSVKNLIMGDLYTDGVTLSQRIWKACDNSGKLLEDVINQCMAQNLSATEMSNVLKEFMVDGVGKVWDNEHIKKLLGDGYAAFNKNLVYEALRLARTTIAHSGQLSMIENAHKNPYVSRLMWHSVHAIGRTCAECKERDGAIYDIKDMPFDHPNGMCYMEPLLDKTIEEQADELRDWILGGSNDTLDEWMENY